MKEGSGGLRSDDAFILLFACVFSIFENFLLLFVASIGAIETSIKRDQVFKTRNLVHNALIASTYPSSKTSKYRKTYSPFNSHKLQ